MTHSRFHFVSRPQAGYFHLFVLLVATLIAWASGCQSMHLSTRSFDMMPERQELALGEKAYQVILDTEPKSQNAHLTQMLERVGQRIAAVSERPDYEWEFTLLSGPSQNAFCFPGGKVGVYEGILPVCQNEAGIAVVLSHEIAHALAQHGGERLSQKMAKEEATWSFSRMIGMADSQQIDMVKHVYGLESSKGVPLPYSRTQEAEADSIGLLLMARAGYDPNEAPRFWERFSRMSGEKTPELLATHPSDETRAAKLKEIVPRAMSVYQGASQRFRLGEQIPMEALAELTPKPTPKTPESEKVAAAPAAAPPAIPAAVPAVTPAPATTVAVTPAPAAATPAPAPAAAIAPAATTPDAAVTPIVTTVVVTPAPIVQASRTVTAPPASQDAAAQLPNVGAPTVEGSAAAAPQTTTANKSAASLQESGGWKSYKN